MGEPIFVRVDCEAFDYVPVRLSSYDVFCLQLVTCVPQRQATDFIYTNHTSSCCQVQTNADFACNELMRSGECLPMMGMTGNNPVLCLIRCLYAMYVERRKRHSRSAS